VALDANTGSGLLSGLRRLGGARRAGGERRAAAAARRLHLSEAQEAGWRDYTLAIGPDPQVEARHRAAAELLPAVPTPRRIALMQAAMDSDAADFRRHAAADIAFYNALTPAQQRTFDQETAPRADSERADDDRP